MEEGVVLEGADLVRGVDHLVAAQAVAVHVVCLEHGEAALGVALAFNPLALLPASLPSARGRH